MFCSACNSGRLGESLRGLRCAPMGCDHLVGASPTRAMVGWPGSWQAVWLSNWPSRSPATKVALGGRANRRAVTCVKPEQASRGSAWTSTQPKNGEDSMAWGSSRQMHPSRSTGVRGTARRDRGSRKRGRPVLVEIRSLNGDASRRTTRESDRVVVVLRTGNAGGAKDPDFWHVCEADEVRRLANACERQGSIGTSQRRLCGGRKAWCEASRKAGCGKSARPV
jgi:hypothetical protein